MVIDFYADWCAPCREFDSVTFRHPEVVRRAKDEVVMIKVDVTQSDPARERLVRRYAVRGVPTVVFIDARGEEEKGMRLTDFCSPEQFLALLDRLRRPGTAAGSSD